MEFPKIHVDDEDAEFKRFEKEREDLLIYHLFLGTSSRDLDEKILGKDRNKTSGSYSNKVIHHYGVWEEHQGIFEGKSCQEALDMIPDTEENKQIRDVIASHADDIDILLVEHSEGGKESPKSKKGSFKSKKGPSKIETTSFFDYLTSIGLVYDTETVEFFLLSLKAKQFVILSGGTGTGKTRLAKAFGDFISGDASEDDKMYRIVPVGSNWTDNRHIIGYWNALSEKYEDTTSLKLIKKAAGDPSHPYMLILDEMNLSHVERYFSDMISCMESGAPIVLESGESNPESIKIGKNLFVVGTVNMDETTYTFSPKVLDRANVLEFETGSVSKYLYEAPSYQPRNPKRVEFLQTPFGDVDDKDYRDMNARELLDEMKGVPIDSIVNVLDVVQGIMSDMGLPFAYRTLDEVMRFMYVAWLYATGGTETEFDWKHYLDAQICQKILPKIHGGSSIMDGLKKLRRFCIDETVIEDVKDETTIENTKNINAVYKRSAEKLNRMIAVLDAQRYVTFNC